MAGLFINKGEAHNKYRGLGEKPVRSLIILFSNIRSLEKTAYYADLLNLKGFT